MIQHICTNYDNCCLHHYQTIIVNAIKYFKSASEGQNCFFTALVWNQMSSHGAMLLLLFTILCLHQIYTCHHLCLSQSWYIDFTHSAGIWSSQHDIGVCIWPLSKILPHELLPITNKCFLNTYSLSNFLENILSLSWSRTQGSKAKIWNNL